MCTGNNWHRRIHILRLMGRSTGIAAWRALTHASVFSRKAG